MLLATNIVNGVSLRRAVRPDRPQGRVKATAYFAIAGACGDFSAARSARRLSTGAEGRPGQHSWSQDISGDLWIMR
jgi:hypothetical protein